jgi:hypothetical protein
MPFGSARGTTSRNNCSLSGVEAQLLQQTLPIVPSPGGGGLGRGKAFPCPARLNPQPHKRIWTKKREASICRLPFSLLFLLPVASQIQPTSTISTPFNRLLQDPFQLHATSLPVERPGCLDFVSRLLRLIGHAPDTDCSSKLGFRLRISAGAVSPVGSFKDLTEKVEHTSASGRLKNRFFAHGQRNS